MDSRFMAVSLEDGADEVYEILEDFEKPQPQQHLVSETGYSDEKISKILGYMEEEDFAVFRYEMGREKYVGLEEYRPEILD